MKNFVAKPAWAALLAGAVLMGHAHAGAPASEAGNPSAAANKAKKSTARKTAQAKFVSGSEETAGERSSRLRRECRGRVNAGVCAGYTY